MKAIKVKTKKRIEPKEVDKIAQTYLDAKEMKKAADAREHRLNAEIKTKARAFGESFGKERLIEGKHYEIGFAKCDDTTGINIGVARKLLKPALFMKLVTRIDGDQLANLVERGLVPLKDFKRMCLTTRVGAERIICREKTKKEKVC